MTETERNQIKGALLKCAEENENKFTLTGHIVVSSLCKSAVERISELEEKISVLLSCKNCSENKGGWICVKEYENKCLAQKIEFIKELEKEKCELLGIIKGKDKVIQELKKENANLKALRKYELNVAKLEMRNLIAEHEKENEQLQEKLNIRSCQNCKHNNKSCPKDGSCVHYNKWESYKNSQLTKAKEIIKDYLTIAKGAHITVCGVPEENRTIHVLKLNEEAEEFLNSEVEE